MRTFLRLKNRKSRRLPTEFRDQDLRYPDELVATFLQRYTRPGAIVLDPFAGYGTTLIVAETLGRVAYGIEFDARRVAYVRSQLQHPERIIHGDARRLDTYDLPAFDFSITSPPFMGRWDTGDPLQNYTAPVESYAAYLATLRDIYASMQHLMAPEARVVLEVANLKDPAGITTFAWDVARAVGSVLHFEGEVVIGWDHYGYGYDHSYCLVFTASGAGAPRAAPRSP